MRNKSLSDFWRGEDLSDDRVMELTSVLQGANNMIGVMGSGVRATWSIDGGSHTFWMKKLNGDDAGMLVDLDYSPLAALKSPFDGQGVDEVIGYAAHEGGHCLWSAGDIRNYLEAQMNLLLVNAIPKQVTVTPAVVPTVTSQDVDQALRILNILEDAFIDCHVAEEWPVLGEYIRWSRSKIAERRPIDYTEIAAKPLPPRRWITNLWIAVSLYAYPLPANMSPAVTEAMTFLLERSVKAAQSRETNARAEWAAQCWDKLQEFPETADPNPKAPPQQGQGDGKGDGKGQGKSGESQQGGGGQQAGDKDAGKDDSQGGGQGGGKDQKSDSPKQDKTPDKGDKQDKSEDDGQSGGKGAEEKGEEKDQQGGGDKQGQEEEAGDEEKSD
ncbi:MAG: hypothetical protein Q8P59_12065 [Dehalococcoidia bacterium]|nr:hypothetical protein [Dehalococcoidia bacterium]